MSQIIAQITNINASQRTDGSRIVDICYDLPADENFSVFSVSLEVSYDAVKLIFKDDENYQTQDQGL